MRAEDQGGVFVSYRRDDVASEARAVRDAIDRAFGEHATFFDTSTALGAEWPTEIQRALSRCKIVLAVIGPNWIRTADRWGCRRIDDESDWVRQELATAFRLQKRVVPVLVDGAELPPVQALPAPLKELPTRQAIELRRDFWDHDVRLLVVQLHEANSEGRPSEEEEVGPYPIMRTRPPAALEGSELAEVLEIQLRAWKCVTSALPEDPSRQRVELFRELKFESFGEVIRFMREVSVGCDIADHHPRWENIYRTLRVYLSTWGNGFHKVTDRDVQLARYFDEVYSRRAVAQRSKAKGAR
jgi:pterin-4a-carbinolamine dehydratase